MAKRAMNKRVLAMVMSMVLLLSMLPMQAMASTDRVMDGYFVLNENGVVTGTTADNTRTENGFTVKKTATATEENKFDITLEVSTSQTVTTNDAAIQLIIDRSNSMAWCAACGSNRNCSCKAGTRMAAVKAAVAGENGFLDSLVKNNKGRIFLSVVTFSTFGETVMDWTEITTASGLASAKSAVNGIKTDGGTNLEAGLMLARNRWGMDAIASCSSKYTVLLTDGAPTYYVDGNSTATDEIENYKGNGSDPSENTINGAVEMATAVKALSILYTISYGVADESLYISSKTVCRNCGKTHGEHNPVEKTQYLDLGFFQIPLYTYTEYYCSGTSGNTWRQGNAGSNEVTVGDFLSDYIATGANNAYDADDIDGVNSAFSAICNSAVEGMTGAGTTVTDPMGQYIILGDISKIAGVTAQNNTLTWALDSNTLVETKTSGNTTTYVYRVTYPITLDTAAQGFQENTYYPANGYTYLGIVNNGVTTKVPFNVPGVKGTAPQLSYIVNYFLQNDAEAGDYANYEPAGSENLGPVKAWTTVQAPTGYSVKFENYTFAYGLTALQVTPNGENVMNLYYNRIAAEVTVNHYYKTDVVDSTGKVTPGTYPATPGASSSDSAYAGDIYQAEPNSVYGGDTYTLDSANPNLAITVSATGENEINLYYTRTLNTYRYGVVYDGNGGTLAGNETVYSDSESTDEVYETSHSITVDANTFVYENHTFQGWAEEKGGAVVYKAGDVINFEYSGTKTLYAIWKENTRYSYSVIYNEGYGENPATKSDSENASNLFDTVYSITVDANTFVYENHTFQGWAEEKGGAVVYKAGDVITFQKGGSKVLYAVWQENNRYSYSVIYNEGYGETPATKSDSENARNLFDTVYSITVDENTFVRTNHTFLGWAEEKDGTVIYKAGDVITFTLGGSKVLYAVWQENDRYSYSVIYNEGYGETPATKSDSENAGNLFDTVYSITVDANSFVRANHTFLGWAEEKDGTVIYKAGDVITFTLGGSKVLYAVWQENDRYSYSVIYNEGYGENPATMSDSENRANIFDTAYAITVDSNTFVRENHIFQGWAEEKDGAVVYQPGDVITFQFGGSKELYAVWNEEPRYTYSVIYKGNGGQLLSKETEYVDQESVENVFATTHSIMVDANTFVRANHAFLGWAEAPDGAVVYKPGDVITFQFGGSKELYAVWQEDAKYSYGVFYNANYGSSEDTAADAENVNDVYDVTYTITVDANMFAREEGYSFTGWNTDPQGNGTAYKADDVITLTSEANTVTLYAQWALNDYSYTVAYLVSIDEGEYEVFAGTLPVSAPIAGKAPYGTVIDKAFLDTQGLPDELSEDGLIFTQTKVEGVTVSHGENVVKVYYNAVVEDIQDEEPPLAENPPASENPPVSDNPKTGDTMVMACAASALISGTGLVGLVLKKKEQEDEEA